MANGIAMRNMRMASGSKTVLFFNPVLIGAAFSAHSISQINHGSTTQNFYASANRTYWNLVTPLLEFSYTFSTSGEFHLAEVANKTLAGEMVTPMMTSNQANLPGVLGSGNCGKSATGGLLPGAEREWAVFISASDTRKLYPSISQSSGHQRAVFNDNG
jgi:hypothetical protein